MAINRYDIILAQLYSELQPPNAEPLAVEVLAGTLERYCQHCSVRLMVVNPVIHPTAVQELITAISMSECKVVGLSVPQGTYALATEILSALEEIFAADKRPLVVLGHALPTSMPEIFLKRYPWTIVVRGWGEDALVALAQMLESADVHLENVPGIAYMCDNHMKFTPLKNEIIPQPARRMQPERFFARVETSRGCHYGRCTFCTRPPGAKDYWQRLPLSPLLASIRDLKAQGVFYFTFTDEDFIGNDLDGALDIASGVAEIADMSFSLSVRADNVFNPAGSAMENAKRLNVLKALCQAGLSWVFIGVESLSDSQLRRYGKGIRVEDSIRAVDIVTSLNIDAEVGFILFDPFVTVKELQQIASVLRTSGIWRYVGDLFSYMRVQWGTPYEYWLGRKGLLKDLDVNLLSSDWEFQDQMVSEIARLCLSWANPFRPIYRLLRNLGRTNRDHSLAERFIIALRWLDLMVLEHVLLQIRDNHSVARLLILDEAFHSQRRALVLKLKHTMPPGAKSDEEALLLDGIAQFLAQPLLQTS